MVLKQDTEVMRSGLDDETKSVDKAYKRTGKQYNLRKRSETFAVRCFEGIYC